MTRMHVGLYVSEGYHMRGSVPGSRSSIRRQSAMSCVAQDAERPVAHGREACCRDFAGIVAATRAVHRAPPHPPLASSLLGKDGIDNPKAISHKARLKNST